MRLRALVACAVLVAGRPAAAAEPPVSATPSEPSPTGDDATASVETLQLRAQEAFVEGRYDEVVELAAEAFARTGDVRHLYAQAHAERFRGRCDDALGLYARVMAADPDGTLGQHAREGIKLCEAQLERLPTVPPPAVSTSPPPRPLPPGQPDKSRRAIDPLGSVLLGLGVASLAAAAGFTVLAVSHARKLDRAEDEQRVVDEQRRARGFEGGAIGVSILGTGLLIGGIVRLVQHSRRQRRH